MSYKGHLFFETVQNLMQISEMERKIEKIFWSLKKIAFELISLNAQFYRGRIVFIGIQYITKQAEDFIYY